MEASLLLETISNLLAEDEARERRVLVVDEDTSALETITHALRERGFEVVEAYDPRGAILKAEEVQPDLVILDAMLSQMNDYELLKALKYQDRESQVCVIVLTAEVPDEARDELLRHGADRVGDKADMEGVLGELE